MAYSKRRAGRESLAVCEFFLQKRFSCWLSINCLVWLLSGVCVVFHNGLFMSVILDQGSLVGKCPNFESSFQYHFGLVLWRRSLLAVAADCTGEEVGADCTTTREVGR